MGIVIRQSIKSSIVSYIGIALGYVNTLILFPYVLTAEQIGLMRLIMDFAFLAAPFAQLGVSNIALRFFPHFKDESKRHNGFLFLLLLIGFVGFSLFVIVVFLFKTLIFSAYQDKSFLFVNYYYFLIPLTFFIIFYQIFESYAQSFLKIVVPSMIREVMLRVMSIIIVLLFLFQLIHLDGFILLLVTSYGIALLMIISYISYLKKMFLKPDFGVMKTSLLKEMQIYGLWVLLGGAGGLLVTKIDTLMISSMAGLGKTGIYSIAFFIATIIEIPKRTISQIAYPMVADAWKNNDMIKIKRLYEKSALNQLIVGSFLFVGIWVNIDSIFLLIPKGEIFSAGKYVVFFVAIGKLIDMATGINAEIIITSRYYRFDIISVCCLALLAIGTNLYFIPLYGITGAAIAAAISLLLFNMLRLIFIKVKFGFQPYSSKIIIALIVPFIAFGIAQLISLPQYIFINIFVRSSIVVIVFAVLIVWMKVSEDINETIFKIISRLKKGTAQ
jgi:O-antigen/teichoic acid export membrane protein